MYTQESLLLEKASGPYLASLSHIVPLTPSAPSSLTLHQKLCDGFCEERVAHVWTATHASQPIIAKIFDPLYFINPYEGTDPFPLLDLSVSHPAAPQALCLAATLPGKLHRVHPPPRTHHGSRSVNVFYDILMCRVKQRDIAPQNLIIRPPSRGCTAPFCDKDDCPVQFSVDPDNVESVMIDFEGAELWDPDHEFYDEQMKEREMRALREDYLEDWWYGNSKDYTRGKNPCISMQFYLRKSNEGARYAEKYTPKGPGEQRLGDLDGMDAPSRD
ncbi:hypothetical protein EDD85DRAFT_795176 [Armillaria nabsnona]|nr:hypothetical protein EDD85DRAFT_795176 [Armillaria nabsnona]